MPDAVLDAGRDGLACFAVFGPRHARATGRPLPHATAPARYDEQQGVDTTPLRADADAVRRVQAGLTAELDAHDAQRRSVAASWSGVSGDAAHAALATSGASAAALHGWLTAVAASLDGCADRVESLVAAKADHVRELPTDRVAATTPEEADDLLELAGGTPTDASLDAHVRALGPWFADRGEDQLARGGELTTEARARAVELAETHLRDRLVPAVEELWHDFDALCRRTDDGVRAAFTELAGVLEQPPEVGAVLPSAAATGPSALRLDSPPAGAVDLGPTAPDPTAPDATTPDATAPDPATPDATSPDPATGPAGADPAATDPAATDSTMTDPAAVDPGTRADGSGPVPASTHAMALHGGPVAVADPGVLAPDASGPAGGALLASAQDPGGAAPDGTGAVLAGSAPAATGIDAWHEAGAWPWEGLLDPSPRGGAWELSLADLLTLVRELVGERPR